jgi:hypothetical protein
MTPYNISQLRRYILAVQETKGITRKELIDYFDFATMGKFLNNPDKYCPKDIPGTWCILIAETLSLSIDTVICHLYNRCCDRFGYGRSLGIRI